MDLAATIAAAVQSFRDGNTGVSVLVRHKGNEYTATRATLQATEELSARGALQNADGAFRLIVSELKNPHPKAGDEIELSDSTADGWKTRGILSVRHDQTRATMLVNYGAQYA